MRTVTPVGTLFDNTVLISHDDTALAAVLAALIALDDTKDAIAVTHRPEAIGVALAESVAGRTAMMMAGTAHGALLTRKRETAEANRRSATREPTDGDAEYRSYWRSLPPTDQAQRAFVANVNELAAVNAMPDLANVTPELRAMVHDRFMRANFIDRSQLAGSYPAQPSLDNPLATGVDTEALDAAAEAVMDRHRARLAQSETDEQTMRDLIRYLAATLDMDPGLVLQRVAQ